MAATEQEQLARAVSILSRWTTRRTPAEIQLLFLELRLLNQQENVDQWDALRSAMLGNAALLDEQLQDYIYEPELAKNGWWWYDRNLWRK